MPRNERTFSLDDIEQVSAGGTTYHRMVVGRADDPDAPTVILTRFAAGRESSPHWHDCDYLELVLEGSQRVGAREFGPGEGRVVLAGQAYGPLVTGPQGALVLHVFSTGEVESIRPERAGQSSLPAG